MGKLKMVCIDIDGTLLNSMHQITPATKEIINMVVAEHKLFVVLVSARPPESIQRILSDELSISMPFIAYNGALVIGSANSSYLYEETIPIELSREVYHLFREYNIDYHFYKGHQWYVEHVNEHAKVESEISGCLPIQTDFHTLFQSWRGGRGAHKILGIGDSTYIMELETVLNEKYGNALTVSRSKPTYLEVVNDTCSKTKAIKYLIEKLEIDQSEIMAIGDNYNDIDMLQFAGCGVAMGNAPAEVKKHADLVTSSNDEDGVAYILSKVFG